jgi:hypothetical protein
MNTITFVVTQRYSPDGRYPFSILRMTDSRQVVVSYHESMDEAAEAAHRYASKARYSGLDARIYQRDWLLNGARPLSQI